MAALNGKAIRITRDIIGTQDPSPKDFRGAVTNGKCVEQSCPCVWIVAGLLEATLYPITYNSNCIYTPFFSPVRTASH